MRISLDVTIDVDPVSGHDAGHAAGHARHRTFSVSVIERQNPPGATAAAAAPAHPDTVVDEMENAPLHPHQVVEEIVDDEGDSGATDSLTTPQGMYAYSRDLVVCDAYRLNEVLASLKTTVPLPLVGQGARIKYRKNLKHGRILLARLARTSEFQYPLCGHFYLLVDATGPHTTHKFLRIYGEIMKEPSVGNFVLPRNVIRIMESAFGLKPRENVTFIASARLDQGPGYKFTALPGCFALTVMKA